MNALASKIAIVTSASPGIAYAAARLCAREGAAVVVAASRIGGLDNAFSNAAMVGAMGPVPGILKTEREQVMTTNLTSTFPGAKYQLPGGAGTPAARALADTPGRLRFERTLHVLKRMATTEEIAQSALHLAFDASSFTTGTAMLVDGSVAIHRV